MPPDERDPFGGYAPEPQTAGTMPTDEPAPPDEIESKKYGSGKPHRIIVRGTVAADWGNKDRRE